MWWFLLILALTDNAFADAGESADPADAGLDATPAAQGSAAGGSLLDSAGPNAPTPRTQALLETAARVRALIEERLDLAIEPASLFDIDLEDAGAVALEARRLEVVTQAPPAGSAASPSAASSGTPRPEMDAGADESLVTAEELDARLELDRVRAAFYGLPGPERTRLLRAHASRQAADTQSKSQREMNAAERRVQAAEEESRQAMELARVAKSEAMRLVAEEHARLLSIAEAQARFEKELVTTRSALKSHNEMILGWHRRVRELVNTAGRGAATPESVDALYLALRAELRRSRELVAAAIAELGAESRVPSAGEDRLIHVPSEIDRTKPVAARKRLDQELLRLRQVENESREAAFRDHYEHMVSLNRDRLSLYPFLSSSRRQEIEGFGAAGLDQARAEVRQVALVLRHHLESSRRAVASLSQGGELLRRNAGTLALAAIQWLFPIGLFAWWRRRANTILAQSLERAREERRRAHKVLRSPAERLLGFAVRVRSSIEWLLLLTIVVWLLPADAQTRLEVKLAITILGWWFGGAAVVATIDALAAKNDVGRPTDHEKTAHLRLRSLRLIGRLVVAIALVLSISTDLVGKGTVYAWISSTSWLLAAPVALVLAYWWREVVFDRVGGKRKKSAFDAWMLGRKTGAASLLATLIGGTALLIGGVIRRVRKWLGGFDLTRRVLAYLFRRDMNKKANGGRRAHTPLSPTLFEALGPDTPASNVLATEVDDELERLLTRLDQRPSGVVAIVGERGSGKSTLLAGISARLRSATLLDCPRGGSRAFHELLAGATRDEPVLAFDDGHRARLILVDDAQRLVIPRQGGLRDFDDVVATARRGDSNRSWIFAFDEAIWRYLVRARGARPVFDDVIHLEPWPEEAIVRLLVGRSKEAGVSARFDALAGAGEELEEGDLEEATERTAGAYFRLIWDYAGGNPGVALNAWRRCLGTGPEGEIEVKVFDAPDTGELDLLPEDALFVLRAVVQLDGARFEDVLAATRLKETEVMDALRYGMARGYFALSGEHYRVTWLWFRPITRFLRRRYLLTS